jgi:FG-GAP-like repeat
MTRHLFICLTVLLLCASVAAADGFTTRSLKVSGKAHLAMPADVDADGKNDVVVSHVVGDPPQAQAWISVYLAANGYGGAPDIAVALPGDTCVFDLADLDGDGRLELVVMRKWRVDATPLVAGGKATWNTLAKRGTGVLFPPFDGRVSYLDIARDWTGDGALELMIPDYGALWFYRQKKGGAFAKAFQVNVAPEGWVNIANPEHTGGPGQKIDAGVRLPRIFVAPGNNGNVLVLTRGEQVWRHALKDNAFAKKGAYQKLAFLTDEERRTGTMDVISAVDDLNGDGWPDLMLNKIGGGLSSFKSAVHVYAGSAAGFATTPAFSFEESGFAAMVNFGDLDGDGIKEMFLPYAEFGIGQIIRMLTTKKVKLKVMVYRGGAGFYGSEPELSRTTTFAVDTNRGVEFRGYPPNFEGDFDGDGMRDLMMESEDGFGVYLNRGGLKFAGAAGVRHALAPRESTRLADLNGDGKSDCLIWDGRDPRHWDEVLVLLNTM